MTKCILIAGSSSGVGKTTITMGLIAALRRRRWQIQPFKAGPDYIDPTYHTLAAGRPCRNIDTWMVPPERALALFQKANARADLAIIEGVMGLFDGYSYRDEAGSSAEIAKLVEAPVLLVLDVGKMARSAGALALGYRQYDPKLKLAGFVLNRCGSTRHYEGVKLAVEQATGLPVVGGLPKDAALHIPERHLGLVPTDERGELTTFINHAADVIEQHLNLDHILSLATSPKTTVPANGLSFSKLQSFADVPNRSPRFTSQTSPHIAVARDAAFSFYYEDNLDLLREAGGVIKFFSPLTDPHLPPQTAGIYLGGGFPEIFAAELAKNETLYADIRRAQATCCPIYAECGGFMYLTEGIIDLEGREHAMVGLIPGRTHMQPRLMSLGYRVVETRPGNFLLPAGSTTRGHEFHWSRWEDNQKSKTRTEHSRSTQNPKSLPAWHIQPRQSKDAPQPTGYATENLIASYIHLHFAHTPQIATNFVQACRQWRVQYA